MPRPSSVCGSTEQVEFIRQDGSNIFHMDDRLDEGQWTGVWCYTKGWSQENAVKRINEKAKRGNEREEYMKLIKEIQDWYYKQKKKKKEIEEFIDDMLDDLVDGVEDFKEAEYKCKHIPEVFQRLSSDNPEEVKDSLRLYAKLKPPRIIPPEGRSKFDPQGYTPFHRLVAGYNKVGSMEAYAGYRHLLDINERVFYKTTTDHCKLTTASVNRNLSTALHIAVCQELFSTEERARGERHEDAYMARSKSRISAGETLGEVCWVVAKILKWYKKSINSLQGVFGVGLPLISKQLDIIQYRTIPQSSHRPAIIRNATADIVENIFDFIEPLDFAKNWYGQTARQLLVDCMNNDLKELTDDIEQRIIGSSEDKYKSESEYEGNLSPGGIEIDCSHCMLPDNDLRASSYLPFEKDAWHFYPDAYWRIGKDVLFLGGFSKLEEYAGKRVEILLDGLKTNILSFHELVDEWKAAYMRKESIIVVIHTDISFEEEKTYPPRWWYDHFDESEEECCAWSWYEQMKASYMCIINGIREVEDEIAQFRKCFTMTPQEFDTWYRTNENFEYKRKKEWKKKRREQLWIELRDSESEFGSSYDSDYFSDAYDFRGEKY